ETHDFTVLNCVEKLKWPERSRFGYFLSIHQDFAQMTHLIELPVFLGLSIVQYLAVSLLRDGQSLHQQFLALHILSMKKPAFHPVLSKLYKGFATDLLLSQPFPTFRTHYFSIFHLGVQLHQ